MTQISNLNEENENTEWGWYIDIDHNNNLNTNLKFKNKINILETIEEHIQDNEIDYESDIESIISDNNNIYKQNILNKVLFKINKNLLKFTSTTIITALLAYLMLSL
jgi:hypothetical protein